MENRIYLDNAATTLASKEIIDLYTKIETEFFGNSSSSHKLGFDSANYLNKAREMMLKSFDVKDYNVYFTGSSTEANNLAIKGYCHKYASRGRHIITSNVEHASVEECFKQLEEEGFQVTYLPVNKDGVISLEDLEKSITNDTILVSLMAVNNEIGSINPISEIAKIVHKFPKAKLHVDTTQAIGKIPFNFNEPDMFVVSAHKIHGLKGSGALIAKNAISFVPVISGGGQEFGLRSGTVSVAHACALAKAIKNAISCQISVKELKEYLISELKKISGVEINTPLNSSDYITNFSLKEKKASVVVEALSNKGIYVSTVSACSSKGEKGSKTVKAIGKSDILAHNTIRVSFDKFTSKDDVSIFLNSLKEILEAIK